MGQENDSAGICPDVPCRSTERCVEGVCLGLTDVICIPGCRDNEICQLGECIPGVEVCTQAGESCDVRTPISGDFFCIDWDGFTTGDPAICSSPCAADGSCMTGEACFTLSGLDDSPCQDDSECQNNTRCVQGICSAAACQPSECEGYLDGLETCERKYSGSPDFPSGASCQELPDGTSFCFAAGSAQAGERCEGFVDAFLADNLGATCLPGLACVQGICRDACDEETSCGAESEECLFADQDFVASGVGFCGQVCAPFSTGECGERGKCLPLDAERGYCVPAGDVEAFEACVPGEWECQEGSTCEAVSEGADEGRCFPLCNVTVAPADLTAPVGVRDQLLRDETCPQAEDTALSYVRVVHMGLELGAYDIYLDRDPVAWVSGLEPGEAEARDYVSIPPGAHVLEFLPAGTPSSEVPVADLSFNLERDAVREVVLASPSPESADVLSVVTRELPEQDETSVFWHLVPDAQGVVFAVLDEQGTELARSPEVFFEGSARLELPAAARGVQVLNLQNEVLWGAELAVTPGELVYWTGTREPDDFAELELRALSAPPAPEEMPPPPRMLCNDLGNGAFGYCQQGCRGARDYGQDDVCEGEGMGCYPVRLPGLGGFKSLCQPEGSVQEDGRCDPRASLSECASGLYCQEYGSGDAGVSAGLARGICTRLCGTDEETSGGLSCLDGQVCQPIDAQSFDVGRCGQSCVPDGSYQDVSCPNGLQNCKPTAVTQEDMAGSGDSAPVVVEVPSVCSASGTIAEGENCPGVDCAPGAECLFPRSAQGDLVSTLLSPYFGAQGLAPTCQAYCDPFDELRATNRCGVGETCLVNFPWSADVGHCAPIVEDVLPFQACSRAGESCGEDSVCVIDGGAPFCLRLCEYAGGSSSMVFEQSTCPAGLQCAPLVNDVGLCL